MAETVKRFREPGAWLVLGVSVVYVVLSLVRFGWYLSRGMAATEAAHGIGGSSLGVVMVVLLVAVALSCVLVHPVTPRAQKVLRLAAGVVALAIVLEVVFVVMGLFAHTGGGVLGGLLEVIGAVLEVGVKAAGAYVLWHAAAGAPAPEPAPVVEEEPAAAAVEEPEQAASWGADQAVGAVWTRAGDAASGAAATTWGTAGSTSSGWDVAAPQAELPAPAPRGPWATAGELADGSRSPEQVTGDTTAEDPQAPSGGVSWTPAPRRD